MLDYKRDLPGRNPEAKRELAADVSAFANATGGHLLFGVEENEGVATNIVGVEVSDADDEALRLDQTIRAGVDPRIFGLTIRYVPLSSGRFVFVVEVPRSLVQPHMVTTDKHDRFYIRHSTGKDRMTVAEIRAAVTLAQAASERVTEYRSQRLIEIQEGRAGARFEPGAVTVLHLMPLSMFDPGSGVDVSRIERGAGGLMPLASSGLNYRYNFDGFVAYTSSGNGPVDSYVQVFRNGAIEAATMRFTSWSENTMGGGRGLGTVSTEYLEREVSRGVSRYLRALDGFGIQGPVLIGLSLLGAQGYVILRGNSSFIPGQEIDRERLVMPLVLTEKLGLEVPQAARVLRPSFDAIWNAGGYPGSQSFNEAGDWRGS